MEQKAEFLFLKVRVEDSGPPKAGQCYANITQKVKLNVAGAPPSVQNQLFDSQDDIQKTLLKWQKKAAEYEAMYGVAIASGGQGSVCCRSFAAPAVLPPAHAIRRQPIQVPACCATSGGQPSVPS